MTSGTGNQGMRYRCRAAHHLSRLGQPLDDLVVSVIEQRLHRDDAVDLLARDPGDAKAEEQKQSTAAAARVRLEQLATAFGAGQLGYDAFTAGAAAAQAVIDAHGAHLAQRAASSALASILDAPRPGDAFRVLAETARADGDKSAAALGRVRALLDALVVVTVLPQHRGRPKGWTAGERAFDPSSIRFDWR